MDVTSEMHEIDRLFVINGKHIKLTLWFDEKIDRIRGSLIVPHLT
jgi:hypothetical protein